MPLAFALTTPALLAATTATPTLTITSPASGLRVTNALYTVRGKASSASKISSVWLKANSGSWQLAVGTTNWTCAVELSPGTNLIAAYAMDLTSKTSKTQSVSMVYAPTAPLVVQMNGQGTLTPNLSGKSLEIGKQYSMTARPASGFSFAGWIAHPGGPLTNGTTVKFRMQSNLMLFASFTDTAKPMLTIKSPKSNQLVSNAVFMVTGTASDNAGVAQLWSQINGGGWGQAGGATNWNRYVPLNPGTNTFQAYAVDTSGNRSATSSVRLVYIPCAQVSVQIVGRGTVTPDYTGKLLPIGKPLSLTAKAAAGFKFQNWSGSGATNGPTLNFVVTSNLTFIATFGDTNRPVNIIASPAVNAKLTNAVVTAAGKASDNVGVAMVWYQFNYSNGWNQAFTTNNWTNWVTTPLSLEPGTNILQAVAVDAAGNRSLTNEIKFRYAVSNAPSDAEAIRAFYATMKTKAERHDLSGFLALFATDYYHRGDNLAAFRVDLTNVFPKIKSFVFNITNIVVSSNLAWAYGPVTVGMANGSTERFVEPDTTDNSPGFGYLNKTTAGWRVCGDQARASVDVETEYSDSGHVYRLHASSALQITNILVTGPYITPTFLQPDSEWGGFTGWATPSITAPVGTTYAFEIDFASGLHQTLYSSVQSWVPLTPSPITVTPGSTSALIQWPSIMSSVPNAEGYWVWVYDDYGNMWQSDDDHYITQNSLTINQTKLGFPLVSGRRYWVQVFIFDSDDDYGNATTSFIMP